MTTSDAFSEAMREEMADRERYRLAHVSRCQACGQSATGAEWDLLRHASAMNFALGHVRYLADATQGGNVPAEALLRAVSEPYRFPLPDGPVSGESTADRLRRIADEDIGGNAPWLADELKEVARKLELEWSGTYAGPPAEATASPAQAPRDPT